MREVTAIDYARLKGQSLNWVYVQCRLGKLPARRVDGQWRIAVKD